MGRHVFRHSASCLLLALLEENSSYTSLNDTLSAILKHLLQAKCTWSLWSVGIPRAHKPEKFISGSQNSCTCSPFFRPFDHQCVSSSSLGGDTTVIIFRSIVALAEGGVHEQLQEALVKHLVWLLSLFSQDAVGYFRRRATGLDVKGGGGQAIFMVHVSPMLFRRRSFSLSFHADAGLEETVCLRGIGFVLLLCCFWVISNACVSAMVVRIVWLSVGAAYGAASWWSSLPSFAVSERA